MAQAVLLISTGPGTGLTSVALGLVHALATRVNDGGYFNFYHCSRLYEV
jgi:BioD-like phosphotransacetylase family protein